jgi:GNAT superfamily N-acetyltransferase
MVLVRETVMDDWPALRDIRLAALWDAPDAFASTYAEQAAFEEADWRQRIARGGTFLAFIPAADASDVPAADASDVPAADASDVPEADASEPAGLVGGYDYGAGTVGLISMFVRPEARGHCVGEALIAAVLDWARTRNASSVHLWVTETNKHARLLYERCGFSLTGERQPLPSNLAVGEVAMTRPL